MSKTELKDTVSLMLGDSYKSRLIAEYFQVKIRLEKLEKYLSQFTVDVHSDYHILEKQKRIMQEYLEVLEQRMNLEFVKTL